MPESPLVPDGEQPGTAAAMRQGAPLTRRELREQQRADEARRASEALQGQFSTRRESAPAAPSTWPSSHRPAAPEAAAPTQAESARPRRAAAPASVVSGPLAPSAPAPSAPAPHPSQPAQTLRPRDTRPAAPSQPAPSAHGAPAAPAPRTPQRHAPASAAQPPQARRAAAPQRPAPAPQAPAAAQAPLAPPVASRPAAPQPTASRPAASRPAAPQQQARPDETRPDALRRRAPRVAPEAAAPTPSRPAAPNAPARPASAPAARAESIRPESPRPELDAFTAVFGDAFTSAETPRAVTPPTRSSAPAANPVPDVPSVEATAAPPTPSAIPAVPATPVAGTGRADSGRAARRNGDTAPIVSDAVAPESVAPRADESRTDESRADAPREAPDSFATLLGEFAAEIDESRIVRPAPERSNAARTEPARTELARTAPARTAAADGGASDALGLLRDELLRDDAERAEAERPAAAHPATRPRATRPSRAAGPAREVAPAAAKAPASSPRRRAARFASLAAMSFTALMIVATSVPSLSLLTPQDVQAMSMMELRSSDAGADQTVSVEGGQMEAIGREGYESMSIMEYAEAAGIRPEATFTNNPLGTIQWPFAVGVHIGDRFGYRDCAGCSSDHGGQDFNPGYGAEIQSIADGVVSVAENGGGSLGVVMMIDHVIDGETVTSVYAHMQYDTMRFDVGDHVKVGDVVGNTGSTGMSTGPHLHFEIRLGGVEGTKVDPLEWLYAHTD